MTGFREVDPREQEPAVAVGSAARPAAVLLTESVGDQRG
jgi:hypothetical protein